MTQTPPWFTEILDSEVKAAPTQVGRLLGTDRVRANLFRGLSKSVELMTDPEALERYHRSCPIEGALPRDYGNQLIELGASRKFLAEIHFENLNLAKPFVEIAFANFEITSCILEVTEAARSAYSVFNPQRICFFAQPDLAGYEPDTICYAAHFGELKLRPLPPNFERVSVRPENDLTFYPGYEQIYALLRERTPNHQSNQESRQSLESAIRDRSLFSILVDGEWAGVFAARRDNDRYLDGYYVTEEVLREDLRGQHLGAALQRRAIDAIDAPPETVFYGHISSTNPASFRTALACGRKAIYTAYWYPISDRAAVSNF